MKVLLVSTVPVKINNVTIHARNAVSIASFFKGRGSDIKLVWSEEQIDDTTQYDHIIFVSATGYFKFEKFEQLMNAQRNCKIGWIANEFELFQNDFLKGRTDYIIANFEPEAGKKANTYNSWLTTNLNALAIFNNYSLSDDKCYDFCYYGSYRKHRIPYFKKWLHGDIVLSTSKKNWHKFASLGCDCKVTHPFDWNPPTLARFRASLYIEDTKTHEHYNYLANRFYECLNSNTVPIFDPSCRKTIERSGDYVIPEMLILEAPDCGLSVTRYFPELNSYWFDCNRKQANRDKQKCLVDIYNFVNQQ